MLTRVRAHVIGTGECGTCSSVLLSIDQGGQNHDGDDLGSTGVFARCLINGGEGLQRTCAQFKVKSAKIGYVLVTRLDSLHAGGLGGLQFSLADAGSPALTIRGPNKIDEFVGNNTSFIRRRWPEIDVRSTSILDGNCHQAKFERMGVFETLTVTLRQNENVTKCPKYCHWCAIDGCCEFDDSDEEEEGEDEEEEEEEEEEEGRLAISFVIRCWSKVSYDRKTPIKSEPGILIGMVDCPSKDYIPSLVNSVHFAPGKCNHHKIKIFFHMGDQHVVSDCTYVDWYRSFGDDVKHVFVHCSNKTVEGICDPFPSSMRLVSKMRLDLPSLFPESFIETVNADIDVNTEDNHEDNKSNCIFVQDRLLLGFDLIKELTIEDNNGTYTKKQLRQRQDYLDQHPKGDKNELDIDDEERKEENFPLTSICFLGTGAAKPAKMRSCSAILLNFGPGNGFALLEAGEGTYGQLVRLYGPKYAQEVIRDLKWIWISHHHLDHHGGLGRILEFYPLLNRSENDKLVVIGPESIGAYMKSFMNIIPDIPSCKFEYLHCTRASERVFGAKVCRVVHCYDAYALAFEIPLPRTSKSAWIIYSGDTRPCFALKSLLPNQTGGNMAYSVLIHEATFDDSMKDQAIKKKHSTTTEALQVAAKLDVDFLIMTHFSQRYPRLCSDLTTTRDTSVSHRHYIFATDMMELRLPAELRILHDLANQFQAMYTSSNNN